MPHSKTAVVAYLAAAVATGLIVRRLSITAGILVVIHGDRR